MACACGIPTLVRDLTICNLLRSGTAQLSTYATREQPTAPKTVVLVVTRRKLRLAPIHCPGRNRGLLAPPQQWIRACLCASAERAAANAGCLLLARRTAVLVRVQVTLGVH